MNAKVWFITGASTGLGREWAIAALARGDRVAGTARDLSRLSELAETYGEQMLPLVFDVKDRSASFDAVGRAHAHFGRLDVVINNAGYGHLAAIEEVPEAVARDQFDTNFFGALWVTQAALPLMRAQGGGHIIATSSVVGMIGAPLLGLYSASKWALEGMTESLAGEVAEFGIKVTLIEPGGYLTAQGSKPRPAITPHPAYDAARSEFLKRAGGNLQGDPKATREAILAIVDADPPPSRVLLGSGLLPNMETAFDERLTSWRAWAAVSEAAQGAPPGSA